MSERALANIMEYEIKVTNDPLEEKVAERYVMLRVNNTIYTIKGSDYKGEIQTYRVYPEFTALRGLLSLLWPGVLIPVVSDDSLPSLAKKLLKKDEVYYMQRFLEKAMGYEFILKSRAFQYFLRGPSYCDFDEIADSFILPVKEISFNYSSLFPQYLGTEVTENPEDYKRQLLQLVERLFKIQKYVKIVEESHDTYEENILHLLDLLENTGAGCDKDENGFQEYSAIYEWISEEVEEILPIYVALQSLSILTQKRKKIQVAIDVQEKKIRDIHEGRFSFSKFLNATKIKTSKERENIIIRLQEDTGHLDNLILIVSTHLFAHEIPSYKRQKSKRLKLLLKKILDFSTNYFKSLIEIIYFTFNKHLT